MRLGAKFPLRSCALVLSCSLVHALSLPLSLSLSLSPCPPPPPHDQGLESPRLSDPKNGFPSVPHVPASP